MDCIICQSPVIMPVQLNCYPCSKDSIDKKSCSSFIFLCIECADIYLELNIPKQKRSVTKKCLLCPNMINPQLLCSDTAYSITDCP